MQYRIALDSLADPIPVAWQVTGAIDFTVDGDVLEVNWGDAGPGTIIAEGNQNCVGVGELCVEIQALPEAVIATTPAAANGTVSVCEGQAVQFSDAGTGATQLLWSFGDGGTSTAFAPDHTYAAPGSYTVVLQAFNDCFCVGTDSLTVQVDAGTLPPIDCAGTVCAGDTVSYSAPPGCADYQWSLSTNAQLVGGSLTDSTVQVVWAATAAEGTVGLQVNSCSSGFCAGTLTEVIPILGGTVVIDGPPTVCNGATVSYTVPDFGGTELFWSVSNAGTILGGQYTNRITVNWQSNSASPGAQLVSLTADNCFLECSSNGSLAVDLVRDFYLSGPVVGCANADYGFEAVEAGTGAAVAADWTVIDAAGTVLLTGPAAAATATINFGLPPGDYLVRATAAGYCTPNATLPFTVLADPTAPTGITGPLDVCAGETYTYEAEGVAGGNTVSWEITDGTATVVYTGLRINHTWGSAPPYAVRAVQAYGSEPACTSAAAEINPTPIGTVSVSGPTESCLEQVQTYTATQYAEVDYDWSISPPSAGSIVSGQGSSALEIFWHSAGNATVNVATCGVANSLNTNVRARPVPTVQAPAAVCENETAAVSTATAFAAYAWYDEEGNTVATDAAPQLAPGYYRVVVTDDLGCMGDVEFFIAPLPAPVIGISTPDLTTICTAPITLYALQTESGYTYQWYQDNSPVGTDAPLFTATQPGTYYVAATNVYGCTANSNNLFLADCAAQGGTCVGAVCVSPADTLCTAVGSIGFQIMPTAACNVRAYSTTSVNAIPGTASWNFDDPGSANNQTTGDNVSHTYSKAGFFRVRLRQNFPDANDPTAVCPARRVRIDTVLAVADFTVETLCAGYPLQFTDLSTFLPITDITDWVWDFGDPTSGAANSSTQINPVHTFATPGTYTASLTVTTTDGCTSTSSQQLEVYDLPAVDFALPTVNCQGTALEFTAAVGPEVFEVSWDFGDPASGDANTAGQFTSYHSYGAQGSYTVTLTATSFYGCSRTITKVIDVEANDLTGPIAISTPPPLCVGETTVLTAPAGGVAWQWSTGASTESITVSEAGVYGVTVTDSRSCTYTPAAVAIDYAPLPTGTLEAVLYNEFQQVIGYAADSLEVCAGEDVYLQANSAQDVSYQWSTGAGGGDISFTENRMTQLTAGTYDYTVTITATDAPNCAQILGPYRVIVRPTPDPVISADALPICYGNTGTLLIDNPQAGVSYRWSTGETGTSITVFAPGEYFVTGTNTFGCSGESNRIEVSTGPPVGSIPSGCAEVCLPQPICLPVLPNVTAIQWFFNGLPVDAADGGNDLDFTVNVAGAYYAELVDDQGCVAVSDPLYVTDVAVPSNVTGVSYMDVDEDTLVSAVDTLLGNIDFILFAPDGTPLDTVTCSIADGFTFENVLPGTYEICVDTTTLPAYTYPYEQCQTVVISCEDGTGPGAPLVFLFYFECPPVPVDVQLSACSGSAATYQGNAYAAGTTTVETTVDAAGCETVTTITVAELFGIDTNVSLGTCSDTLAYQGYAIPVGTTQAVPTTDSNGCPATTFVTAFALSTADTTQVALAACVGQSVTYAGTNLTAGSQQTFTLVAQGGCDSLVQVDVATLPVTSGILELTACVDTVYAGTTIPVGNTEVFTLTNAAGCDSILTVTVLPLATTDTTQVTLTACPGGSVDYHGGTYQAGTTQLVTLSGFAGCDSLVLLTVVSDTPITTALELFDCAAVSYNGTTIPVGTAETFVFAAANGCDSTVIVSATAFDPPVFDLMTTPSCADAATGSISLEGMPGGTFYTWSFDGGNTFTAVDVQNQLPAGDYTVVVRTADGCTVSETVKVEAYAPLEVALPDAILSCGQPALNLQPEVDGASVAVRYRWNTGDTTAQLAVVRPGNYSVTVSDACETVAVTAAVTDEPDLQRAAESGYFYVPNAFAPDGSGDNAVFRCFATEYITVGAVRLQVFDRWGALVYEEDSPDPSWNGRAAGMAAPPGVYIYRIRAAGVVCGKELPEEIELSGSVTLLR